MIGQEEVSAKQVPPTAAPVGQLASGLLETASGPPVASGEAMTHQYDELGAVGFPLAAPLGVGCAATPV